MILKKFGGFEAYKLFLVDLFSTPQLAPHANKRKLNLSVRTQQKYGNTSMLPAFRLCNFKESFKNSIGLKILKN